MNRIRLIASILLLFCMIGCKNREPLPEGVLSVEEYADLLADLYLAEGYFAITTDFQFKNLGAEMAGTYDTLLAQHHVSTESLSATTNYYLRHREENRAVYELVMEKLEGK